MERKEMEGYVDEMYAMHRQLLDMHEESTYRIKDITKDAKLTADNVEHLKEEMLTSVSDVKKYCRRLTAVVIGVMLLLGGIFYWNFYLVIKKKEFYVNVIYTHWKNAEEVLVRQERLIEEYKKLREKDLLKKDEKKAE